MATAQEKKTTPLAARLRKLVAEWTLTQKEIAERVGVKPQSISQYLDGTVNPSYSVLIALADLFNVSIDYLFGRTEIATDDIDLSRISKETGLSDKAIEKLKSNKVISNVINHILCSGSAGVFSELAAAIHDEIYLDVNYPEKIEKIRKAYLDEKKSMLFGLTAVIFSEKHFLSNSPLGAHTRDLPSTNILRIVEAIVDSERFTSDARKIGKTEKEIEQLQKDIEELKDYFAKEEAKK